MTWRGGLTRMLRSLWISKQDKCNFLKIILQHFLKHSDRISGSKVLKHLRTIVIFSRGRLSRSLRVKQINTKFGQCNLKPFVTLNCEDLEFLLKGVSVAAWQLRCFAMKIGRFYNSGIQCPICPKLHMFMRVVSWTHAHAQFIVIAPPAGNRKWHVLHYNELLI